MKLRSTFLHQLAIKCSVYLGTYVAKHGLGGLKPDQIASKPDQIYYSPFLCWGLEYISCEKNSLLAS